MNKTKGWEARLKEFLLAREGRPIILGKNDCASLVCDAFEVMTGRSVTEFDNNHPFQGNYSTLGEVDELTKQYSGGGLTSSWAKLADKIGWVVKPVSSASFGDIAVLQTPSVVGGTREIMGVVSCNDVIAQGKNGLVVIGSHRIKMVLGENSLIEAVT